MAECSHSLPCPCLNCSRPCRKKVGWITGDVYCATHGRDKGWPCPGYIHEPMTPVPWHIGDDGEVLCSDDPCPRRRYHPNGSIEACIKQRGHEGKHRMELKR